MNQFSFSESTTPKKQFEELLKLYGKERAIDALKWMLLIRNFEIRGEAAYQQGFVGGFYHSYIGQEAIQTAVIQVFGKKHWYTGFYRCHALALLLGATPEELMAELYGKETGNAKGRGGSMHLFANTLLGGFAIVGGHLPIACGAAFSIKYQDQDLFSLCFLGEGAVAQGAFHESLNLAALWNLPVIFIIENNKWGMGTHVSRAIATQPIAEKQAASYGIKGYTLDGMDWVSCTLGFKKIYEEAKLERRPILVECICDRFKGHSISDPAFYRSKEILEQSKKKDPIALLSKQLLEEKILTQKEIEQLDEEAKEKILRALEFAEKSPLPPLETLEEDVYA